MNRSLLIQIGILAFIGIIGYSTFIYLNKNEISEFRGNPDLEVTEELKQNKETNNIPTSNQIIDLAYKSSDERGNIYEIKSVSGSIEEGSENVLILNDVTAKILINNYGTFFIKSGKAKYNKYTLDTHFFDNVNLNYLNHSIKSEDLFLKYIDKEIRISNNVVYKNQENLLKADEVDLDMITKTSKIYMKDKTDKIKAIIKN